MPCQINIAMRKLEYEPGHQLFLKRVLYQIILSASVRIYPAEQGLN